MLIFGLMCVYEVACDAETSLALRSSDTRLPGTDLEIHCDI